MEFVHLAGAEEVSRAASRMSEAASEMNRAAANMADVFAQHQRFMDDWLCRAEEGLSKTDDAKAQADGRVPHWPPKHPGRAAGGRARAASMTPEQRTAVARKAAQARWGNRNA